MNYQDYASQVRSEKLVMCWIEPAKRMINFTLDSGAVYSRLVPFVVIGVKDGSTSYDLGSSSVLNQSEFFYDFESGELYIRTDDDSDPKEKEIIITYRLFFSNAPINAPYDLDNGPDVCYEPLLKSNSPITKEIDEEQIGIILESSTNLAMENTHGYFDPIYDTLIWEFKKVELYSWNLNIPLSEKKLIFRGSIQDKDFSSSQVGFKCKDFILNLRQPLNLPLFSSSDGTLSDSLVNTPKRRLYGQFKHLKCAGLDSTLNGFSGTGTITATVGSATITGIGTDFLNELSPEDKIKIVIDGEEIEIGVEQVNSATEFIASDEQERAFTGLSFVNEPSIPYRRKNRIWSIAGHKLRSPSTTVTAGIQPNRFTVTSVADLFAGDLIQVDGEFATIKAISGDQITLRSNLQAGTPSNGDTVTKSAVSQVHLGSSPLAVNRDWTLTNTTEAKITLDPLAEFNIAKSLPLPNDCVFTNGSRIITTTLFDFKNEFKPRDWIRSDDISHAVWYEVLTVSEQSLTIRTAYAGGTTTTGGRKKNVTYAADDALITVNCLGLEKDGVWVKTASQAVQDMVQNDAGLSSINTASFTESRESAPQTLSITIPESIEGNIPPIRDIVTKINESVFGSLVTNSDYEVTYNVLSPDRPTDGVTIKDDDLLSEPKIQSRNEIVRAVNAQYRPFVDIFTGENTFEFYKFNNDFVNKVVGATQEKDIIIYLFGQLEAETIAQRYALYNSLSQSVVRLSAKLLFARTNLNDKININLRRLYNRFGGSNRSKIGIVNRVTTNGANSEIEINDLGNTFNRVGAIADNSSSDFTGADENEKLVNGYIVDDDLMVPDVTTDEEIYQNLIG